MEYESHEERCANHDLSYNIEYKSQEERCANNVEYKSKRKTDQEGGVKLSYVAPLACLSNIHKVESVDVATMYIRSMS